ncbi:MAG TPA: biopolymer transporter ExbD [Cyclobacteriaceae bacterium]|nr:biopolymer transporter ExbD [Cyclobacteriaceae bacterium]
MARATPEIPNASMADIAFLLLTFFLVTTTISNDRGLSLSLPPPPDPNAPITKFQQHNLFTIQLNSSDNLLVEGEPMADVSGLKEQIKKFIMNGGVDPELSDSPEKAVVSFKTDRGTTHRRFVELLDIIQGAYYDIWADRAGVTNKRFREAASDLADPENKAIYDKGLGKRADGSNEIPMAISIAEPTKIGG